MEAAFSSPMVGLVSKIHICTDNLNIVKVAWTVSNGFCQVAFIRFRKGVKSWLQTRKKMSVQWVPSHMGIQENKRNMLYYLLPTPLTPLIHARRVYLNFDLAKRLEALAHRWFGDV